MYTNGPYASGGSAGCTYKAHITCGNPDAGFQDICGYYLPSAPDGYVNEAWFGLNRAIDCGDAVGSGAGATHHLTALSPRPVVASLTAVYGGPGGADATQPTCEQMRPCYQCVAQQHSAAEVAGGACNAICSLKLGQLVTPDSSSSGGSGGSSESGGSSGGNNNNSTGGNNGSSSGGGGGSSGVHGSSGGGGAASSSSTGPVDDKGSSGSNIDDGGLTGRPAAASALSASMGVLALMVALATAVAQMG
jgi:hypothetical protein